jgi:hypothetical protein
MNATTETARTWADLTADEKLEALRGVLIQHGEAIRAIQEAVRRLSGQLDLLGDVAKAHEVTLTALTGRGDTLPPHTGGVIQ